LPTLNGQRARHQLIEAIVVCLVGLGAFLVVCGPAILNPENAAWLTDPDPATFLYGWRYFRAAPWSWPPGLNPDYGLGVSSSIVYSDSIPLFALPMKIVRSLWDIPQFAGIWLLACFVLQALFGWLVVGLASTSKSFRLLGAALFLFMPMFLWRLNGHYALCAHWLILAGLLLALRPMRPNPTWWLSLLVAAAFTQVYILLCLLPLWAADLVRHHRDTWGRLVAGASLTLAVLVLSMWLAGYFAVREGLMATGYGFYHVNLLSPINPMGWSLILPTLPAGPGDYEGFIYLGAGGLMLLAASILLVCARPTLLRAATPHGAVLLALMGLLIYAITNRVGFAAHDLQVMPLPLAVEQVVAVFRASGRLCWPVVYGVVLGCMVIIVRSLGSRRASILLACALVLQIVDTSAGWRRIRAKLNPPPLASPAKLVSTFWPEAAAAYRRVMVVPPGDAVPNWSVVARFASENGLPTNAINFGRIDHAKLQNLRLQLEEELSTGNYTSGSLYVLNDQAANLSALAYDPAADLLAEIDGLRVLAPGWKHSHHVPGGAKELTGDTLIPQIKACGDNVLDLTREATERDHGALVRGWSTSEEIGVWSAASVAELAVRFPYAVPGVIDLVFNVQAYLPPSVREQHVRVSVDGQPADEWLFTTPGAGARRLSVRRPAGAPPVLRVRFDLPDAISQAQLGIGTDWRSLALAVARLEIRISEECARDLISD
jgi:hypothetical protein